jgi:ABC-type lipoprotein export system ATPase subunit
MTMIQVDNVYKHFDNGLVKALDGVSLDIPKGEFCAVTGPSGCGKSTLLNLIGALDTPTQGKIHVRGRWLTHPARQSDYRKRFVGFVFQFHHLLSHLTLAENVALPALAVSKMTPSRARQSALGLLSEMGLENRADFRPTQVSGGERQRAAVARALINSPQILLADEPTGSVDSSTAEFIMTAIVNRCRKHQMTVLLVTHDRDISARADRIIRMQDGIMLS